MDSVVPPALALPGATRRDAVIALLLAGAALLLFASSFVRHDPLLVRMPAVADPIWRAEGFGLARGLRLFECGLLGLLAVLVALRGRWLRQHGGLFLLDRHPRAALACLVCVHAVSIVFYLPPRELASSDPAVTCDNAYHYYQVFAADRLLSQDHHLWGYDPYFMAGYPAGVIFDLDMKGAELFCHAFAWVGLPYAFKAYIVLAFVLFPPVLYAAGRGFGLGAKETLVVLLLGLVFWHWGRPLLGHFRWAGMHSYILASYLSVLALALFVRWMNRTVARLPRVTITIALVAVAAIACQVHPLSALLLAPGFAAVYAGGFRRLRRFDHLILWTGLAVVIAANSDWILPFLRFRQYKTASNYWFQLRGLKDIAFLYTRETSLVFSAITVLGVFGLVLLRRRNGLATLGVAASAAFCFGAAFFGARFAPLANTEPGRYLVPFAFLMTLPAGLALVPILERIQRRIGPQILTVGLVAVVGLDPMLSFADNFLFDVHHAGARIEAHFVDLMRFLAGHTTADARILFETPGGFYNSSDLFYGGHLQALVPIYTGRELIGGPYPVNFLVHSVVDFKNGELLGKPLSAWPAADFGRFVDTYNVGWVVCWSQAARAYLNTRAESATQIGAFDRFGVYALGTRHDFMLTGTGHVAAGYNRIEVTAAAGDEIVLKYHWLESLRTKPPLPLDAFPVPGDPIGFIRVHPGATTHFVIYNGY